jgi:hypothetical protein
MAGTALAPGEVMIGTANAAGLYIAPVGTAAPTDTMTAWGSGWRAIGYISDEGITMGSSTESEDLIPWQSRTAVRTILTSRTLTLGFTMWQLNEANLAVYFDSPAPTGTPGDSWKLDVRSDTSGQTYAIGIDTKDGDNVVRYIFGRANLKENGDIVLTTNGAQGYPVVLSALDNAGVLATIMRGPAVAP